VNDGMLARDTVTIVLWMCVDDCVPPKRGKSCIVAYYYFLSISMIK